MSTEPEPTNPRSALSYRDFRLFITARFFTMFGAQIQSVAIGWHVYELTRKPLSLGYVGLATFVPLFGFSLFAGHVADRFDRRLIIVATALVQACCSLALTWLIGHRLGGEEAIYAVLVVVGIARAFGGPAGSALVPSLVATHHFSNAVAWGSSVWQLAMISGPAVGGALYGWTSGGTAIYLVCAACFVSCALLVAAMHVRTGRSDHSAPSWESLLAGVRYVFQRKVILGAISLDLFAVLLGGAVALLPVYARDILHVGPAGLGVLRGAPAFGAAAMAVVFAYKPLRRHAGVMMLAAVALFGVATIVFGLSTSFPISLVALAFLGAFDMVSVIVRQTVVQLATPSEMRGRVSAVSLVFISASNELGEFESGITAAAFGTVRAVVMGGVGTLAVVALWAIRFRDLRNVDRLDHTL